jgi:tRNA threonylcarbamoyl adenosine modification protein YeaZ
VTHALAIDTTSEFLSLAVLEAGRPVANHYALAGTRMNRSVLLVIEELLAGAGLTPEALDLLIVARGPGSFTGTRIGLAVAKSFAQVHRRPLIGLDTLHLLAAQSEPVEGRPFHALLNCARDELYHAPFGWREGRLESQGAIGMTTFAALPKVIGEAPVVLRRFEPADPAHEEAAGRLNRLPLRCPFPDGLLLLREGLALYEANPGGPFPAAEPIYLKSEAFRKWKP